MPRMQTRAWRTVRSERQERELWSTVSSALYMHSSEQDVIAKMGLIFPEGDEAQRTGTNLPETVPPITPPKCFYHHHMDSATDEVDSLRNRSMPKSTLGIMLPLLRGL